jgi:hypothetical protein
MTTQTRPHPSLLARAAAHVAVRSLVAEFRSFWREFFATAFRPYHPERHYMRGPGPACAAKRKSQHPYT